MVIFYPTSLANLVDVVGTRHCHQILLRGRQFCIVTPDRAGQISWNGDRVALFLLHCHPHGYFNVVTCQFDQYRLTNRPKLEDIPFTWILWTRLCGSLFQNWLDCVSAVKAQWIGDYVNIQPQKHIALWRGFWKGNSEVLQFYRTK